MKINFSKLVFFFLAFVVMNSDKIPIAYAGNIMIIANKDVPEEHLTQQGVSRIFTGKTLTWKDGRIIFIVLQKNEAVHNAFLTKYIKRTASQFERQWRMNIFTGKGKLPVIVESDKELSEYVKSTEGAIGYVSSDFKLPESIKVIAK